MQPGDAALVRPTDWTGRTVSFLSESRYCHIRLITDPDGGTVEANPDGAARGHVRSGDIIIQAPLTDQQRGWVPAMADTLIGTPYDFADVAALALVNFGITLPTLTRRVERPDRLFCSQLVDIVWQGVGYHAFNDGRVPQQVTPGDIADLAFSSGWKAYTL